MKFVINWMYRRIFQSWFERIYGPDGTRKHARLPVILPDTELADNFKMRTQMLYKHFCEGRGNYNEPGITFTIGNWRKNMKELGL